MATRITEANPKGDEVHLPVEEWARASFEAGIEAYSGIEPHTEPSQEYLERGRAIAFERLALAGYRLAYILNHTLARLS
ncbi:MAG: hypothetical protein A3E26_00560 [Chlamydiae bacterium RIFCSPHIGHO2_12_FULL_49_32]|nr:MAG: hypothetical protein A3E26_00560 [Chlamydiae bacterium RIFCSPHIGHO2_12_FULL_49_32]